MRPSEEIFAKLSERIEGYGGHYFDTLGNMRVFVVSGTVAEQGQLELRTALRERHTRASANELMRPRLLSAPEVIVERGDYTWGELVSLRPLLNNLVLGVEGVAFTDVAESRNRLVVAVVDDAARDRVVTALRASTIPEGVIALKTVEVPALAEACSHPVTINQWCRGVRGGLEIRNQNNGRCTVGFNARDDQANVGFVTASHCTGDREVVQYTFFFQPVVADAYRIGLEIREGPFFNYLFDDCPDGARCRYADAAFVRYLDVADADFHPAPHRGGIARVSEIATGAGVEGGRQIGPYYDSESDNRLKVSNKGYYFDHNYWMAKTGATTGGTAGQVSDTCIDVPDPQIPSIVYLCQVIVSNVLARIGDSGAPVFSSNSDNIATIYGVLWIIYGESAFGFSPIAGIEKDLGILALTP